jgi:hypothetical protein
VAAERPLIERLSAKTTEWTESIRRNNSAPELKGVLCPAAHIGTVQMISSSPFSARRCKRIQTAIITALVHRIRKKVMEVWGSFPKNISALKRSW